jgi:nicotinamidase-related amidase
LEPLDPSRTCILVFDLLEGYVSRDRARFAPVLENAARVIDAGRSRGAMIAYAHADHRADRATSARTLRDTDNRLRPIDPEDPRSHEPLLTGGTAETRIAARIAPREGDYLIPKHRWSAFHGTYLDLALRTRRADTLAARDLDYNLVIVSDACTSPEGDNHDQLMRRIFPRMARVRTARQVISMLLEEPA